MCPLVHYNSATRSIGRASPCLPNHFDTAKRKVLRNDVHKGACAKGKICVSSTWTELSEKVHKEQFCGKEISASQPCDEFLITFQCDWILLLRLQHWWILQLRSRTRFVQRQLQAAMTKVNQDENSNEYSGQWLGEKLCSCGNRERIVENAS